MRRGGSLVQRLHCQLSSGSFGDSKVGTLTNKLAPGHPQSALDLSVGECFCFTEKTKDKDKSVQISLSASRTFKLFFPNKYNLLENITTRRVGLKRWHCFRVNSTLSLSTQCAPAKNNVGEERQCQLKFSNHPSPHGKSNALTTKPPRWATKLVDKDYSRTYRKHHPKS